MYKRYIDTEWSEAKKNQGMFSHEIGDKKTIKYQN